MTPPSEAPAGQAIEAVQWSEKDYSASDSIAIATAVLAGGSDTRTERILANALLSLHAQNERLKRDIEWMKEGTYHLRAQLKSLKDQP